MQELADKYEIEFLLPSRCRLEGLDLSTCRGRIYESRSQNGVLDRTHHRTDDSIRRVFSADLFDEQRKRLHGKPAATEFFPRRARSRRCDRDPVADLSNAGGRGRSADVPALVRPSWSAAVRDSHFGGVLLLDAAADRLSSHPSGLTDLRGTGDPCLWSRHTWH